MLSNLWLADRRISGEAGDQRLVFQLQEASLSTHSCDQSCVCIGWSLLRYVQRAREIVRINFGAEQINELLGGGLESKAITEMFGEYRYHSKSQISWSHSQQRPFQLQLLLVSNCA